MEWIRLLGLCMLTAALVVTLRQMNSVMAGLLCGAFSVMLLSVVLPEIHGYIRTIHSFLMGVGLEGEYYAVMLKAMGIVLVTQIAAQICCDLDAQNVAQRVELCGRLALLGIAVPIFIELTQIAVDVLR